MLAATEQYGIVYGTEGYLIAYNINNIDRIEIFTPDRKLKERIDIPPQITGYEYEVLSCKKALEEGRLECPEMPHSETLKMMEWMDALRKDWGSAILLNKESYIPLDAADIKERNSRRILRSSSCIRGATGRPPRRDGRSVLSLLQCRRESGL